MSAAAPAAAAAPVAAGMVIEGLVVEGYGQEPALWACFFIFGNVFAAFWLVRAFLNAHPEVAYDVGLALARLGLRKRPLRHKLGTSPHGDYGADVINSDDKAAATKAAAAAMAADIKAAQQKAKRADIIARASIDTPSTVAPPSTPRKADVGLVSVLDTVSAHSAGGSSGSSSTSDVSSHFVNEDMYRQPVQLDWRNLCYSVNTREGRQTIVQGIYGCAQPFQLQGLMGPSGAGKSTLMDLLAMRTAHGSTPATPAVALLHPKKGVAAGMAAATAAGAGAGAVGSESVVMPVAEQTATGDAAWGGEVQGALLVNGVKTKRQAFMAMSAYVPQHDNLVPTMTAYEAVSFYASIILPAGTPKAVRRARISRVLAMMGLTEQKHTLVGGILAGGIMLRGLSGGERKRLAIACGVVAGPSLVFLDEPTSGLDSFAALNVVSFLKGMATDRGATLLASLHQPRAAIWSQLDQVTLLSSGRLMYTGPTRDFVPWFSSIGYNFNPVTHGIASDWALDLVSLGFTKQGGQHAADHQQQQQEGSSSSTGLHNGKARQRNATSSTTSNGMVISTSMQQLLKASEGMMKSKAELEDAATAFLNHLRQQYPDWFNSKQGLSREASGPVTTSREASCAAALSRQPSAAGEPDASIVSSVQQSWRGPSPDVCTGNGKQHTDQNAPAASTGGVGNSDVPGDAVTLTVAGVNHDTGSEIMARKQHQEQEQLRPRTGTSISSSVPSLRGKGGSWSGRLWHDGRAAFHKYRALLWRELLITTRNPADVGGRMMTFTWVSFVSGLVGWSLPGGADGIFQRIGVCYAVLSFYLLMPFVFMSIFTSDKRFFAADTTARLYHPAQYYLAKVSVTLPFNVVMAVVFHLIYYGMAGMRPGAEAMVLSCIISVLIALIAMQAIYCCAIMASSQDLAFVYAIAWTALNLLVNPYMQLFQEYSLGWGFSWLRFFSPCSFAWQALIQVEFRGRGFDCNSNSGLEALGVIPELLPDNPTTRLVRNNMNNLGRLSRNGQCVASGDAIISLYTMDLSYGANVAILVGYFVLFLIATYIVIQRSSKQKLKL